MEDLREAVHILAECVSEIYGASGVDSYAVEEGLQRVAQLVAPPPSSVDVLIRHVLPIVAIAPQKEMQDDRG